MRIDAHPLVVAAALGLLGPAALADDEPVSGLGGEWARTGDAPGDAVSLGATFEVIPLEEHFTAEELEALQVAFARVDVYGCRYERDERHAARLQREGGHGRLRHDGSEEAEGA